MLQNLPKLLVNDNEAVRLTADVDLEFRIQVYGSRSPWMTLRPRFEHFGCA